MCDFQISKSGTTIQVRIKHIQIEMHDLWKVLPRSSLTQQIKPTRKRVSQACVQKDLGGNCIVCFRCGNTLSETQAQNVGTNSISECPWHISINYGSKLPLPPSNYLGTWGIPPSTSILPQWGGLESRPLLLPDLPLIFSPIPLRPAVPLPPSAPRGPNRANP